MSDYQEIHQYDTGTQFIFTVKEHGAPKDISDATVIKILFYFKNKSHIIVDGQFLTDGTDGLVSYITGANDITVVGDAWGQVYYETPTGKTYSSKGKFIVKDNIATVT